MPEWSEFWWKSITGPRNLTIAVARALHDKSNVCLIVPDDLPWRDEMRGCIETELHQLADMDGFYVEFIDVEDECAETDDVGRYLLERYALPSVATGYRGRERLQKYMLDNKVLSNRVLWIKGMNVEQEKRWLQFCREYVPGTESDGRFVLEVRWSGKDASARTLSIITYSEMINSHDLSLFNSIFLNREKNSYSPIWQQYIAVLCALLCNTDAETSKALMTTCDFLHEEPICGMRTIAEDDRYHRRGEKNGAHVLSMVRQDKISGIETIIWQAQLQVLFPLLEIERVSFVNCYHPQIEEALKEEYYDNRTGQPRIVYQFGEPINSPEDAELGTLFRMMRLKRDSDLSQYLLYIPNESSRSRIELLHDIRNALAHRKCCSIEQVSQFVDEYPFLWQ